MTKIFAVVVLVLGGLLAYRGFTVWNSCGYDCAIAAGWSGFTATAAMLLGFLLLGASALALLAMLVGYRRTGGHQQ
jgi:hypothetical protein